MFINKGIRLLRIYNFPEKLFMALLGIFQTKEINLWLIQKDAS